MSEDLPCPIVPPIDETASKLKGAIPSNLKDLSPANKLTSVSSALNSAKSNIQDIASNAVENFKKIKTGELPQLNKPEIDPTKIFNKIDDAKSSALNKFNDIKSQLSIKNLNAKSLLEKNLDCADVNVLNSNELASVDGNLLKDVSKGVSTISPTMLRDFNKDSLGELEMSNFSKNITDSALENEKIKALKGKSFEETADAAKNSLSKIKVRKIKVPDITSEVTESAEEISQSVTSTVSNY